MVDFSMGTIYLMVGYMTSGHGPLHVPRADLQLKPMKTGAVAGRTTRRRTTERTHAGAGSRRHPAQGARPQQSKAVVVHGRVGAGIKGVQPPLCVKRVRGFQCHCARRHQQPARLAEVFNNPDYFPSIPRITHISIGISHKNQICPRSSH